MKGRGKGKEENGRERSRVVVTPCSNSCLRPFCRFMFVLAMVSFFVFHVHVFFCFFVSDSQYTSAIDCLERVVSEMKYFSVDWDANATRSTRFNCHRP